MLSTKEVKKYFYKKIRYDNSKLMDFAGLKSPVQIRLESRTKSMYVNFIYKLANLRKLIYIFLYIFSTDKTKLDFYKYY